MDYEQFLLENKILPLDCESGRWNCFKNNPKYNKTGITFYRGEKRILKLVNLMNTLKVEFNVPVAKVEGLTTLTKEEAKGNKMGTCQWIYKGKSLDTAITLIEEAKEVYLQKH